MTAVIFEAWPAAERWDMYLDIAAALRPELSKVKGFISVERFKSMTDPEKVLSLSFWENEDSVHQWRNHELHRTAQQQGRSSIFRNYRIRIASVARDYSMNDRSTAPADSKDVHK